MSFRAVGTLGSLALLTSMTRQPSSHDVVFVSNEASHDVSVIDATTNKVVATIPVGARARGIHVSPDGRRVY
ncbi:MAG TPA: hypothetical protein VGP95_15055, partial [Gemmatimonadaceae bacterium]|nr:hypothetical protein [Gemmatimonadaceae bacterium]